MSDVLRPTYLCGIMLSMELYHVIYRGVDGRPIFMDDSDRARFVHNLYEFNDTKPADTYTQRERLKIGRSTSDFRERIVDLHGWKLMLNHVHLIISERVEHGLAMFLRKMTGYGRYFNERHERRGSLFDKTKKVLIEQPAHFLYILHYVHLNGLDDLPGASGWRERDRGTVADVDAAIAHLQADKWSSFRDYCDIRNFPSILTKSLFEPHSGEYITELKQYLADRTDERLDAYSLE